MASEERQGGFRLELITPWGVLLDEQVDEAIVPAHDGQLGVLPGHEHYMAMLVPGALSYRQGDEVNLVALSGGFLQVRQDGALVLARTAERASNVDVERARASLQARQEELAVLPTDAPEREELRQAIERANARLHTAELHRKS